MPAATAFPAPRLIGLDGLGALYRALAADGELARVFATFNAASPALAAARRREG
jgi:hypothetical protein